MARPIAIYDACVLYPAPLRDFLMQLALTGLFQAKWTNRIHDEWIRNLLENRPDLTREQLEKTRRLMNAATQDSLIEGYDALIKSVKLPDEDDRHVLAAAIHSHANVIVTFNLKDFPLQVLRPHKIEAMHPDAFVMRLIERDSAAISEAARIHRGRLHNPPKSVEEYLATLSAQGLAKTVAYLRGNMEMQPEV